MNLKFVVLVVGVICLFLAGLNVKVGALNVSWGWLGLAFIALAEFLL